MFNKLKDEKVILDLKNLVEESKEMDEVVSSYVVFMKERILSVSGLN